MIWKNNKMVETSIGKAYAFFDCQASKERIESEIPYIRDVVQTPSELELSLIEGMDVLIGLGGFDSISQIAREAKEAGIRYAMQAGCPNLTNQKTADELASILNQAYQSDLYQRNEKFRGWIFYEENGEYLERE